MSQHRLFNVDTDVPVYFCDPHSPWQRGSNENTNRLLRRYFPKSTNLRIYTPEDLLAAAAQVNSKPLTGILRRNAGYARKSKLIPQCRDDS